MNATSFQLQEVFRGQHVLQAEVLNAAGEVVVRSEATTFYVQQTSVVTPPR